MLRYALPAQVAILAAGAATSAVIGGSGAAVCFVAGGLVAAVPHAIFVVQLSLRRRPASAAAAVAAEMGRFALSAAGFALVFSTFKPVSAGAVFTGFVLALLAQLAAAALALRHPG